MFILWDTAVLISESVIPNPPSPIKLITGLDGFAILTPKPQEYEKPTSPKSRGVNKLFGLKNYFKDSSVSGDA